jgi:REP element-mobilizing transposase RayT
MSFPKLCLNCLKYSNETFVLACESCEKLQFPEKILCDITRLNIRHDSFECDAFKPKLSLTQKGEKTDLDSIQEFDKNKSQREKWIASYILQQHKLNPDQIQFKLKYHLELITKNRISLFLDMYFQSFSEIFDRAAKSFPGTDVDIMWLASDHLHLYLDSTPDYAIDEIIQSVIKKSEFEIFNRFPDLQKETKKVWNRDYFVETVG